MCEVSMKTRFLSARSAPIDSGSCSRTCNPKGMSVVSQGGDPDRWGCDLFRYLRSGP